MRVLMSIMLAVAFSIHFDPAFSQSLKQDSPPNIIFIFADDWGYGDLGCYGHTELATPNLDQLAAEGTRYTQFHVTSSVCSPSRSSVITGHFPPLHRVHGHFASNTSNERRDMPNWLNEELPVYLPRLLQEAGYTTAHFGKWHLGGGGLPHGDLSAPEPKEYGYDETRVWNGNGPTWKGDQLWPTTRYMDSDTVWVQNSSKVSVDATIDFMKRNQGKSPLFVNLWLKDPHGPIWPSEEQKKPYNHLSPGKEKYYAVITDADYHVGRLMKALKEMGLEEKTLVLFSSDNGPSPNYVGSTAGLRGGKFSLLQGGVNVPFIARWPGHVKAGAIDSTSVMSAVDLLPTFCELAGKDLPSDYKPDGESFASIFENTPFERTKPIFWEWRRPNVSAKRPEGWPGIAVRYGDWKLVVGKNRERVELFNIAEDRLENRNLVETNKEKRDELLSMWDEWKSTLPE